LPYRVVKYVEGKQGVKTREVVTSFAEKWEADEFAQSQLLKDPLRPIREALGDEGKVRYVVEEERVGKEETRAEEKLAPTTISELIATAIMMAGGRAKLPQIYPVVNRVRPEVSGQSIRGDLYHGIDADKFRRNTDGTYSLGSKLKREILNRPIKFSGVQSFHTFVPFQGIVSVPSEGVILGNDLLEPYTPKEEDELEEAFIQNYKKVLGQGTQYLPIKKLVGSRIKKVTDGLLIHLNDRSKPSFWIVEVELSSHDLERHVQTQIVGFLRALEDEKTLRVLIEFVHRSITRRDDTEWYERFFIPAFIENEFPGVPEPYKFVDSLLHGNCGVLIVIDRVTPELQEIVEFLSSKRPVRVVEFKTFKKDGELVYTFSQPDLTQSE
jgi:hypothetical protein